ncbi:hypothetical protein Pmar_PMAR017638 [Perkinsus marinus ATCC 50983]|uniref:Uncharacterized protein n=1 Tax=Perkinsus marinus (strain ATCC 50983 / TXsc) TaxID=423536 RepID=C5L3K6_PERM5|nr:hypothetical protein Pmar_PMAR017638 [Perkinsus marinus ATCC 50983]EER08585.1 hypothetical protein Pmar_PMAR017638 [Perkinsus marinus ATCC 50983]|eukprot:XP_002776769.1 hypothetical protein Pmar_PMAR017638 [Perkinsus marinus ATCC 50983]
MPKPEPVSVTTNKKPIENNQIAKNPQWQKAFLVSTCDLQHLHESTDDGGIEL